MIAKIKAMKKLLKTMDGIKLSIPERGGQFCLKHGKYNLIPGIPDQRIAEAVLADLAAVLKRQRDTIEMAVDTMEAKCEQITMDLFTAEGECDGRTLQETVL